MAEQVIIRLSSQEYHDLRTWLATKIIGPDLVNRKKLTQGDVAKMTPAALGFRTCRSHISRASKQLKYAWPNQYIEKIKSGELKPLEGNRYNATKELQHNKEDISIICDVVADLCESLGYDLTDTDFARIHALSKSKS